MDKKRRSDNMNSHGFLKDFTSLLSGLLWFTVAARADCSPPQILTLRLSNCSNILPGVDTWGALLTVAGQSLCVMPSTFTPNIYIMGTDICKDNAARQNITTEQCHSRRGGTFSIASAQNQSLYLEENVNDLLPDSNWENINNDSQSAFGQPGKTVLDFPLGPSLSQVLLSTISEGQNYNLGHLGIEQANATFLEALDKAGYASNGWSLNAGSTSVANPRSGNIVFGGYDPQSVAGLFTTFQINNNPSPENIHFCPLQVQIRSMEIIIPGIPEGNTSNILIGESEGGIYACIEPYDNLFRFSQSALSNFQRVTGYGFDKPLNPEFYTVEPGLIRTQPFGFSLRISLESDNSLFTVDIPNEELEQPRRVINSAGQRVLLPNITEAQIHNSTVEDRMVLGKAFLSQVYLMVNFHEGNFQLAPIVTDLVTPQPVPFECSLDDLAGTVSTLKKVIIALGTVLCILMFLVVGMLIFVRQFALSYARRIIGRHSSNSTQDNSIPARNAFPLQKIFRRFRRARADVD